MKLLFVNAHPDDVEFTCASTKKQAVDLGWNVYEILMTSDEYGTSQIDFKGERIRKIRKHEMYEAAKVYGTKPDGTPKINLIWFGEIDGYLPFNRDVFQRLRKKVFEIKPDIVIGPDSFFSLDLHPDHKHTGWLVYFVVKSIEPPKRPKLLLYHSFAANYFVRIKRKDIKMSGIQLKGWEKHRSQSTPLGNKIVWKLRWVFYNLRRRKTGSALAEGFRKIIFIEGENNLIKLRHRMFYHFIYKAFSRMGDVWLPPPEELGLR